MRVFNNFSTHVVIKTSYKKMIQFFKDKLELKKAKEQLKDEERPYLEDLKKAKKEGKSQDEIDMLVAEMRAVCQPYEFDVNLLESQHILNQAHKLYLPAPDYEDENMYDRVFNYRILNERGKLHLMKNIQKEKRERTDILLKRISIFIGLIGALTGLVAVWKN